VKAWEGRRLLIISYNRVDDQKEYHIAFNLRRLEKLNEVKKEIAEIGDCLKNLGFITTYQIVEKVRSFT
jgi:hypothetical protein